jgi:hypothetical protein
MKALAELVAAGQGGPPGPAVAATPFHVLFAFGPPDDGRQGAP